MKRRIEHSIREAKRPSLGRLLPTKILEYPGSQSRQVLAMGRANGGYHWVRGGRAPLSLSRKGQEWSGRPFAEAQTRRARATKPSIAPGADGRASGTEGFSG